MELDNLTRAQLQAGLQAVIDLHQPDHDGLCDHCNDRIIEMYIIEHPCPTVKAAENAIINLE